jgi:cysteine synthase B
MANTQTYSISGVLKDRLRRTGLQIGRTPLADWSHLTGKPHVKLYAKLEWQQLGGSVKSRPAFHIFRDALLSQRLRPGQRLLDATSGNTGIAYAAIGAALGIGVTLCLPENASPERKRILKALGTELILTSRFESTDGAQDAALELAQRQPGKYFYADQYANPQNWKAHYDTTAPEIWEQTRGAITHFVAGLGTTGTFTGTSRRLRELQPGIQLISLQPDNPMHGLEGWKHLETAKVPRIYDDSLAHRNLEIDTLQAFEQLRYMARREGLLLSPSAAANLCGALVLASQLEQGLIVTTFADNADKYGDVLEHITR